jgi:hypothetical protein
MKTMLELVLLLLSDLEITKARYGRKANTLTFRENVHYGGAEALVDFDDTFFSIGA